MSTKKDVTLERIPAEIRPSIDSVATEILHSLRFQQAQTSPAPVDPPTTPKNDDEHKERA